MEESFVKNSDYLSNARFFLKTLTFLGERTVHWKQAKCLKYIYQNCTVIAYIWQFGRIPKLIGNTNCFLPKMSLKTMKNWNNCSVIDWLIDWCLTPTLTVLQLYRGMNKFSKLISSTSRLLEIKHICVWKIDLYVYVQIKEKLKR